MLIFDGLIVRQQRKAFHHSADNRFESFTFYHGSEMWALYYAGELPLQRLHHLDRQRASAIAIRQLEPTLDGRELGLPSEYRGGEKAEVFESKPGCLPRWGREGRHGLCLSLAWIQNRRCSGGTEG